MNFSHDITLTNRLLFMAVVLAFAACTKVDDPGEDGGMSWSDVIFGEDGPGYGISR